MAVCLCFYNLHGISDRLPQSNVFLAVDKWQTIGKREKTESRYFFVVFMRLYMSLCRLVGLSVCPSVGSSLLLDVKDINIAKISAAKAAVWTALCYLDHRSIWGQLRPGKFPGSIGLTHERRWKGYWADWWDGQTFCLSLFLAATLLLQMSQ